MPAIKAPGLSQNIAGCPTLQSRPGLLLQRGISLLASFCGVGLPAIACRGSLGRMPAGYRSEGKNMPIWIKQITSLVSPAPWQHGAELSGSGGKRALMKCFRIGNEQIELCPGRAVSGRGIRQSGAQKLANALLRHEAKNTAAGQLELGHPGNAQARKCRKDSAVKALATILIGDIENEMNVHDACVAQCKLSFLKLQASTHASVSVPRTTKPITLLAFVAA